MIHCFRTGELEDGSGRRKDAEEIKVERPTRAKVSAQDALKKMREFGKRREKFVAAIREGKS